MSRIPSRPQHIPAKPIKNPQAVIDWKLKQKPRCQVCYSDGNGLGLSPHHIVHGPFKSDEPCNLLLVCLLCHGQIHDSQYVQDGERMPALKLEHVLWCKNQEDARTYDRCRLQRLHHGFLPRAAILPDFYLHERAKHHAAPQGAHHW